MTPSTASSSWPRGFALSAVIVCIAALVLGIARWHTPFMIWDQLDLVPLLEAWSAGRLSLLDLFRFHGGHWHGFAYLPLLATARYFPQSPWLDSALSMLLLLAAAWLWWCSWRRTQALAGLRWSPLIVLLLLYPGHLANLQWGWQIAVFLSLFGVAGALHSLTQPAMRWRHNLIALACTVLAVGSFATGVAVVPVALWLLLTMPDTPLRKRVTYALPWFALLAMIGFAYGGEGGLEAGGAKWSGLLPIAHYAMNYLGGGITRFVENLAAPLAAMALLSLAWMLRKPEVRKDARVWIAACLFALCAAGLTALGRAAEYGADHAFVTRYVSFSILFWLGWVGVSVRALSSLNTSRAKVALRGAVLMVALFATANAIHLIKKAQKVGTQTRAMAEKVRMQGSALDDESLRYLYYGDPADAQQRIETLKRWHYPPFEAAPAKP